MKDSLRKAWPHVSWPSNWGQTPAEIAGFWIGTGFGSGLMRPASGTWGSLVGMGYLFLWAKLPAWPAQVAVGALVIWLAVWASGHCEKLFAQKDPKSVVIDEIAPVPLAFWPLVAAHEERWWVWIAAFCLYRVADILKPWPAREAEALPSGLGIVIDDVISSFYASLVLFACERFLAAP